MAIHAKKTEHTGPKKGFGAYWGYKKDAKKDSNRRRRQQDRKEITSGKRLHRNWNRKRTSSDLKNLSERVPGGGDV